MAIADMCRQSRVLADVGCDHGYIPIYLLQNNFIESAFAMDINSGPLEHAALNASREGVSDRISFILSDGLSAFPVDAGADTLLIAGMGGELIERIITDGREKTKSFSHLVLSPHTKVMEFRRFLGQNGFRIVNEKVLTEDRKLYTIIKAEPGEDSCHDSFDYEFGPYFDNNMNDGYRDAINDRIMHLHLLLEDKRKLPDIRCMELEGELELYEEAEKRFNRAGE